MLKIDDLSNFLHGIYAVHLGNKLLSKRTRAIEAAKGSNCREIPVLVRIYMCRMLVFILTKKYIYNRVIGVGS